MVKQVYCAWAGEEIDEDEHEDCICRKCDQCGKLFKGKDRFALETHLSVWLHKRCVLKWLDKQGQLTRE